MIEHITEEIYEHVINERELSIYYQPIVSLDKERMIGCEALVRASYNGEPIAAEALFNYVRNQHNERELDFLCREEALKEYIHMKQDVMLFINFEAGLLNDYIEHLDYFVDSLNSLNVDKEKIVIEINEKRSGDDDILNNFVTKIRAQGFLIALDDVGEGHSNLNRIVLTKPDIIKIDRNAIKEIQKDYYKCEIVRSITYLASRIGAVVIAEGVEEQEEIFLCLSLGITLFQGFYFSKAVDKHEFAELDYYRTIHELSNQYHTRAEYEVMMKAEQGSNRKFILRYLARSLMKFKSQDYEKIISTFFRDYEEVECAYIINNTGRQITRTLFNINTEFKSVYLFSPAKVDDYHIVKPYYYVVMNKKSDVYVSDRYISAATGLFCETYSCVFYSDMGEELILCIDFSVK